MKRMAMFSRAALLLLCLMMAVPQIAFAGGADPEVEETVFDTRICGRNGTDRQANTVRWTNIFSNGDPATDTGRAFPPNTSLSLVGRDFWGCWVQVESDMGNGWVPIQSLNTRGVLGLPVTFDNSNGCQMVNGQITGCSGATNGNSNDSDMGSGTMTSRWTDVFSSPSQGTSTGIGLAPNTPVTVISTSGSWSQIQSAMGNGWVPTSALK